MGRKRKEKEELSAGTEHYFAEGKRKVPARLRKLGLRKKERGG